MLVTLSSKYSDSNMYGILFMVQKTLRTKFGIFANPALYISKRYTHDTLE